MSAGLPSKIEIRAAASADLLHVKETAQLWGQIIGEELSEPTDRSDELLSASFVAEAIKINIDASNNLIAIDTDRKIHAIALYEFNHPHKTMPTKPWLYVEDLLVSPERLRSKGSSRTGMGRKMMVELYKIAQKTEGVSRMYLRSADSAKGFYKQIGMDEISTETNRFETKVLKGKCPFLKD